MKIKTQWFFGKNKMAKTNKAASPRELYFYATKVLKSRYEEAENVIVKPYNYTLKKFVSKEEEKNSRMFFYAIAYLRNILLKRSPTIIIDQYKEKLEKQLIKFFDISSVLDYASACNKKLPEKLHNRIIMESMNDTQDNWKIESYVSKYMIKQKHTGPYLSRNQIVYNLLVDNPNLSFEETIAALRKVGILVSKKEAKRIFLKEKKNCCA